MSSSAASARRGSARISDSTALMLLKRKCGRMRACSACSLASVKAGDERAIAQVEVPDQRERRRDGKEKIASGILHFRLQNQRPEAQHDQRDGKFREHDQRDGRTILDLVQPRIRGAQTATPKGSQSAAPRQQYRSTAAGGCSNSTVFSIAATTVSAVTMTSTRSMTPRLRKFGSRVAAGF